MKKKWLDQIETALAVHNITVIECRDGRKHTKLTIMRGGETRLLVVAVSPSDHRAIHNITSVAKKTFNSSVNRP